MANKQLTLKLNKKLSCVRGDNVDLRISESGRSKIGVNACTSPCDPCPSIGGCILSVTGCGCDYTYIILYDSDLLSDSTSSLVSSDISKVSCSGC